MTEKTTSQNLATAKTKVQDWYDNEFMPYKKQREQEKQDFTDFAKIVVNNTAEIKYMLANIYDNNSAKVVETWNTLNLEPKITDIKLEGELLTITQEDKEQSSINFDELLANIEKILGE